MELTEKWIGKVAGWKVLKAGRTLWKSGSVKSVDSAEAGKEISGLVGGGEKPRRVRVYIHGENDVENKCTCLKARRTGEICEHVVALFLQHLNGAPSQSEEWSPKPKAKPVAVSNFEPQNVSIHLPPKFPEGIEKGLNVKVEIGEKELSPYDLKFCAWLYQIGLREIPPLLSLRAEDVMNLLDALSGHEELSRGGEPLKIVNSSSRLPVEVEHEGDRIGFSCLRKEGVECLDLKGAVAYWEAATDSLSLIKAARGILKEGQMQRLAQGGSVFMSVRQFIQDVESWEEVLDWGNTGLLESLRLIPAPVQFMLQLEGSLQHLQARLYARYAGGLKLALGTAAGSEDFPIQDRNNEGVWFMRNHKAEQEAEYELLRYGFKRGRDGQYSLEEEQEVLDFLSGGQPELRKKWSIEAGSRLKSIQQNVVRVKPDLKIEGSGEDWLAFDYGFQTDEGKAVPREAIEKMLRAGKRSATTKNGKRIIISDFDAQLVQEVLRDVDPRQEAGKYYVPKNQGAYLKRLKSFYGQGMKLSSEKCLADLPEAVRGLLRDYQGEGIAWLYQRITEEGAALLADDMGLGKTLQTLSLAYLSMQQEKKPTLVVCPTSLLENWQDEVAKFFPSLSTLILHGPERKKKFNDIPNTDVVITSYALAARDLEEYTKHEFSLLVIDEASVIRNPDTQSAKALRKFTAHKRIALTGTPVENSLQDLWSIFEWMMPSYLGARTEFKERYVAPCSGTNPDKSVLKRLRMRVEPFMLRRTKQEVARDLPSKIEQVVWCHPTALQSEAYQAVHRKGLEQIQDAAKQGAGRAKMQMLTVLLRMRQVCCDTRLLDSDSGEMHETSAKLVRLLELVEQAVDGGHRMLVFSQFTSMLGLIKEALEAVGVSFCYLDGATRNRGEVVKQFQKENGPTVFLISLKAGGYGLNLTAADMVVHFDPWWNPAVEAQATDRAYRIGQTRSVNVYKMVTKGTVEEKIVRLQEQKRNLIDATVDDESLMSGLSKSEIASLMGNT